MSGSKTIAMSETRLEALRFQSSAYGGVVPVTYGLTRIAGNLMWYGGFRAIPHTSTEDMGGKGGGGIKQQSTTYTYEAAVMMALGEGEATNVTKVWRGKKRFVNLAIPAPVASASQTATVPTTPFQITVTNGANFYAHVMVEVADALLGWRQLNPGPDYTLSSTGGVYTFRSTLAGQSVRIQYQYLTGVLPGQALTQAGLSLAQGKLGQAVWTHLSTNVPAQALGYSGFAHVRASAYSLGSTAEVENHNFEVQATFAYHLGASVPDVDAALVGHDILTNDRYGVSGFPESRVNVTEWSTYCRAAGLLVSPSYSEQEEAAMVVNNLCKITNTGPVWAEGILRFVPFGDQTLTANGQTYTPNTTPIYDLDDRHFLDKDTPIKVIRKPPADAYNFVQIEFRDRANDYNISLEEAKDQADIDTNGLRPAPVFKAHQINDRAVARVVAENMKNRHLFIRAQYEFKLPWNYGRLTAMDLVTIMDPVLLPDRTPVRIIETDENEDGDITFKAEDFPVGSATATLYPSEGAQGFSHDYNVAPEGVATPVLFEAPVEMTTTGLEVYAAVKGTSVNWGGCRVWVSTDGSNYRQVTTIYGGARYGTLTSDISPPPNFTVNIGAGNTLTSGSASDADALATLCYIGGANPEYLAYTTATLNSPGNYTLNAAVRGAYDTIPHIHTNTDPFVRVDQAIAKSGPLPLDMIGRTIYFKFTSFNVYGGGEQTLDEVSAFAYAITGYMAALPPSQPTGGGYETSNFKTDVFVNVNAEPDVRGYEWRLGATLGGSTLLDGLGGTRQDLGVLVPGTYTVWVAAVDFMGNKSPFLSFSVPVTSAPAPASISSSLEGADFVLSWTPPAGLEQNVEEYEYLCNGVSFGRTRATSVRLPAFWAGSRTWTVRAWVAGVPGAVATTVSTITAPGLVQGARADVIDNNVNIYFSAPATGSLPLVEYRVIKGGTLASGVVTGGTSLGSNGNSTFFTVFEQQSGDYTYHIIPVDSAGTLGPAFPQPAKVSQPPDYILRVDQNSTFGGTHSGTYVDNGRLCGPSFGETVETHFVSRSWASVDAQQVAGFPLAFQPSSASGQYEETIDYGSILPATSITVTMLGAWLSGTGTAQVQIGYSADGTTYTYASVGTTQVVSSGFRYARVRVIFTASGGDDLFEVSTLNIKLSAKLKTDSGTGTAVSTDSGGTTVTLNLAFVDVEGIVVTAAGTTPLIAMYDFVDAPNPTTFKVLLFDRATGARASGPFSWTARGY